MAKRAAKPLSNSIDFNKLRKRRQRATVLRRLLILSAVALVLLGVVGLNSYLVEEGVSVRLSDMIQSMGGSGYPVALPGGAIRNVQGTGDHLAVLTDTSLYLYNTRGKQVSHFQRMSANTVLLTARDRLLTFDKGAKRYTLHSHSKELPGEELEFGIINAALNDQGDYAIISSANSYISEINVFNKKFQNIGTFSFIENIMHTVALSPKGTGMVAAWPSTREGALYSGVKVYRLDVPREDAERAEYILPDNLIVDLWFQNEDVIEVLGDRRCTTIDTTGSERGSYDYDGRRLLAAEHQGGNLLLLLEDLTERRQDLVVLDANLKEKSVYSTFGVIQDIALSARRVYYLEGDVIYTVDHHMQPTSTNPEFPVERVSHIAYAGDKLYYLTREEICQLPRQREEFSSASELESPESDEEAV